jgi:hypothetical protein
MMNRSVALVVAFALSASIAMTAGCASVRSGLGTSSAVCYSAIPVGRAAIGKPAPVISSSGPGSHAPHPAPSPVFVGIRSASQKDIDIFGKTHDYLRSELDRRNGGPIHSLCLVAFRGSFDPNSVKDLILPVPPVGRRIYAVVVVSEPHNKLLATFIRTKVPLDFAHYAVGGG